MSNYPLNIDGYLAMSEQLQKVLETYQRIIFDVDLSPLKKNMAIISDYVKTNLDPNMCSRLVEAITPMLTTLEATHSELADRSVSQAFPLSDETVEALQRLKHYVPEEKRDEFQEIIQPEHAPKGNLMTFDRAIALVALLISLLTLVTFFLPDKEEQLSNANEATMLDNQRETNALLSEQNHILQNISDALQAIRDDCDAVPELASAVDDLLQDAPDGVDAALDRPDPEAQNDGTDPE